MEQYYFKPDNRKAWQKSVVLAVLVLALLYLAEAIQSIPYMLTGVWYFAMRHKAGHSSQGAGHASQAASREEASLMAE
jgi:hypothetical protein